VLVVPLLPQSAPIDPDWLLSSTVQSAAVLVAIVGGFLVSRLVTLSAERGAILQRRQQRDRLREIRQTEYDEVHADRVAVSTKWFVDHHKDQLLEARGRADIESLLEDFIPRGSSYQEMRPVAENLINSIQTAFPEIESKFSGRMPPRTSSGLRESGVAIPEGSADIYEIVASHIADEIERSRPRTAWEVRFIPSVTPTPEIVYRRLDAKIDLERELNSELRALNSELILLDEELSTFKKPEGIKGAIAVLLYLTLAGIALPTILMALRPVPDSSLSRAAVVAAFVSGLAVLVGYLLFRVRSLKPPSS
jgi:hypothetical protein